MADESSFNPLAELAASAASSATKRRVRNIIRSYHNAVDVLMEPIQNAVDEVLLAGRDEAFVRVAIDVDSNRIEVRDNGRGMPLEAARRYIAPDQGSKEDLFREGKVRGHKGVGMTFLAYGFNNFVLESRTEEGEHYRIRLEDGRSWVEDMSQGLEVAPIATVESPPTQPKLSAPGTSVSITVGGITMPSSLTHTFNSATYTQALLETQTAIGIVPPADHPGDASLKAELEYRRGGDAETVELGTTYRFPHEHRTADLRVFDLGPYLDQTPVPTEVPANLRKKHHACHWMIGPERLVDYLSDREPDAFPDRDALLAGIKSYEVHVYGLVSYSATYRDRLGDSWGVPGNRTLHHPGFRIATDTMISSWKRDTALTHRGFFVDRLWLTYHFKHVEPDQGRKDFPPQVLEIVNLTEEKFANRLLRQGEPFLKPTPKQRSSKPEYKAPSSKADERRQNPLGIYRLEGFGPLTTSTVPGEEQDVVGLFFELIGLGVLRHIQPVYVSGVDDYDGWVVFEPSEAPAQLETVLPGVPELAGKDREGVIEFKRRASDVLEDTVNATKSWQEMLLIACWEIGDDGRSFGGDTISFHEVDEADERRYAGVTHLATLQSKGDIAVFVIELKTLLAKLAAVSAA